MYARTALYLDWTALANIWKSETSRDIKIILIPYVHLGKLWTFAKFGGCGSKNEPATPISILNFPRAWQPQFLSHTLQILIKCVFFIDKQMMFSSFVYIFYRIPAIFKKLTFFILSGPHDAQFVHHGGHLGQRKSVFRELLESCKRYK